MESLKHRYAKEAVARWLREHFAPHPEYRVVVEFPVTLGPTGHVHGLLCNWGDRLHAPDYTPSYDECIANEWLPLVIFDVVVLLGDAVAFAYEIVHTNPISPAKWAMIDRIAKVSVGPLAVGAVDAHWVLTQHERPQRWEMLDTRRYPGDPWKEVGE